LDRCQDNQNNIYCGDDCFDGEKQHRWKLVAEGDEKPTKYSPFRAIDRKGYTQLETVVE